MDEEEFRTGIPRRCQIQRMVKAELAIRAAMQAVEEMGADVRLTDAINHLSRAKDSVADFVDGVERIEPAQAEPQPHHHAALNIYAEIVQVRDGLKSESKVCKEMSEKEGQDNLDKQRHHGWHRGLELSISRIDNLIYRLGYSDIKFKFRQNVQKAKGYKLPGKIVAVFENLSGQIRYVVECTIPEVAGLLHIYSEKDLIESNESDNHRSESGDKA